MSEPMPERAARLLQEGLDYYGSDATAKAILAWEQALIFDPGCSEAADYIKTADRRTNPRPQNQGETSYAVKLIVEEARLRTADNELEEAQNLLACVEAADPHSLEAQSGIELVRSRLFRRHLEEVGGFESVPVLKADLDEVKQLKLDSDSGFMLSMVDGSSNVADLISASGLDGLKALGALRVLLQAEVVGMER